MVQDVGVAVQSGRSARHHHGFVETGAALRHRRGFQVEVDVVGDEEVEFAVAIVIDESATCGPAGSHARDSGLLADVGEGAVAVVVVEHVLAVVGDEQIVVAVVVVVADADALSPAGVLEPSLQGDVGEGAVAIVLEQVVEGLFARRKAFEPPAVDQEDVEPAVVVVVVEGDAAAGGLEQIFVLVLAAEDRLGVESGFVGDVDEGDAEVGLGFDGAIGSCPKIGSGRTSESTSEKASTSAERQRDCRNFRRDCDKRKYPPCS